MLLICDTCFFSVGETLMSSLVFNSGIVLLCSLPLAHFTNIAFSDYASNTANQCNPINFF